jgi:flagellar operon protein
VSQGIPNPALLPPGAVGAAHAAQAAQGAQGAQAARAGHAPVKGPRFEEVLAKQQTAGVQPPRFSRHALDRLARRGIQLTDETVDRLAGGMARAAGKGSRDSVVFVDGTAFVVSVANNTVLTAVGTEHMREHVFTNIDSAVIA